MLAGLLLTQRANSAAEQQSAIFWGNAAIAFVNLSAFLASPTPTSGQAIMLGYLGFVQIGLGYLLFTYGLRVHAGYRKCPLGYDRTYFVAHLGLDRLWRKTLAAKPNRGGYYCACLSYPKCMGRN